MKTAALQLPLEPIAGNLNGRIEGVAIALGRILRSAGDAPMQLCDTERLVREAEERRAAFIASR